MSTADFTTWLEIDLRQFRKNIQMVQTISGKSVMAIVKANAYGHGKARMVKEASKEGLHWFGVARIEEAAEVRANAPDGRILVMGFTPPQDVATAVYENISLAVYDLETARMYSEKAVDAGGKAVVHIKYDTGMGRLGYNLKDYADFAKSIFDLPGLMVEGVFTHFACADEPSKETTHQQIQTFNQVLNALRNHGLCPAVIHASNSAAIVNYPQAGYTMVRSGMALYGLNMAHETWLPAGFGPVMTLKSRLTSIKTLPAGQGVSYGHSYFTPHEQRIGVVGVGYADGFRRILNASSILVHGKKVPVVGMVAMDQCMVALDDVPEAKIGEEVVIFGSQGDQKITVEELADVWGTIPYEVICGMSARLPRIYIE